jgi:NAD(P)-dependent dehydrogenase (short-subunit alcohol dehydrogenase family)
MELRNNKVLIVSGSARGIGVAIAKELALALQGAKVAINYATSHQLACGCGVICMCSSSTSGRVGQVHHDLLLVRVGGFGANTAQWRHIVVDCLRSRPKNIACMRN